MTFVLGSRCVLPGAMRNTLSKFDGLRGLEDLKPLGSVRGKEHLPQLGLDLRSESIPQTLDALALRDETRHEEKILDLMYVVSNCPFTLIALVQFILLLQSIIDWKAVVEQALK